MGNQKGPQEEAASFVSSHMGLLLWCLPVRLLGPRP